MPNTPRGLPYPSPTDPVAQGAAAIQALAVAVDPLLPIVSATPPASPVDGMIWALVVDATKGIVWLFRYRAASASAFKWEFVGGPKLTFKATDYTVTAVGGWQAAPGTVAFPRGGDYDVDTNLTVSSPAASGHVLALTIDGSITITEQWNSAVPSPSASNGMAGRREVVGVAVGQVIGHAFYSLASVGTFTMRFISILPRRVS